MELKDYIIIAFSSLIGVIITVIAIKKAKKNINKNEQRKQ